MPPPTVIFNGKILSEVGAPALLPAKRRMEDQEGRLRPEPQLDSPVHLCGRRVQRRMKDLLPDPADGFDGLEQPLPVSEDSPLLPESLLKPPFEARGSAGGPATPPAGVKGNSSSALCCAFPQAREPAQRAAAVPARAPKTRASVSAFPASRFAPWSPPVTSPAA